MYIFIRLFQSLQVTRKFILPSYPVDFLDTYYEKISNLKLIPKSEECSALERKMPDIVLNKVRKSVEYLCMLLVFLITVVKKSAKPIIFK